MATPSRLIGPIDAGGFCVVTLSNGGASWDGAASVQSFYTYLTGLLAITWNNGGIPLSSGGFYDLTYSCQ